VSQASRLRTLEAEGLLHPRADAVTAALFAEGGFFLAADKVQVKYEMLRAHLLDGVPVTAAAAAHGYSRAGFYLVAAAFEQAGMSGLLDDKRGRRPGPAPSWPRRSPTGSGWYCTGAPWNGPGGGERPCAGLARSPVLAGRGGGAGATTRRCGRTCSPPARRRTAWPPRGSPAAACPG
jgi:hypothetical protein